MSCRKRSPASTADVVIAVLEQSEAPLTSWDIAREAASLYDRKLYMHVGYWDRRICWAGPGLYGLYRHGLIPGVRTIGDAAAFYVHAAGGVTSKQLFFIMRRVGYRFSHNSLTPALNGHPWTYREPWGRITVARHTKTVERSMTRTLDLANQLTLKDVLRRTRKQVETETEQFYARLYGSR